MKKITSYITMALLGLAFASCDNRPDVVGQWQGKMEQNEVGMQALYTVSIGFESNGTATASILTSIEEPMAETDSVVSPYQLSAAGTATMNGTWQYVQGKNDEIAITYNPSSLQVKIEPQAVIHQENVFTGTQDPQLENLNPKTLQDLQEKFSSTLQANAMNVIITHIKVDKSSLHFSFHGDDYTFNRTE